MTEFRVHDVVEHVKTERLFIVRRICGNGDDGIVSGSGGGGDDWYPFDECRLAYRPDAGVMDKLEQKSWSRYWLGNGFCVYLDQGYVVGDCVWEKHEHRLSSGTLHPESALRLLQSTSLDAMASSFMYVGETVEAYRKRVSSQARGHGGGAHELPPGVAVEYAQSKTEPPSPNCASCGDALHEVYDPTVVFDGQRVHGSCASRLERLKVESAPRVTRPDPYAAHRDELAKCYGIKDDAKASEAMRNWYEPIARFTADTPPKYEERVAHPWSAEDVDDV